MFFYVFARPLGVGRFNPAPAGASRDRVARARERARADRSRVMAYALVVSQTVRVAAAARGTRRAVSARRPATVAVRASYRSDDVAVSVRATRAVGGLASVAVVAAAPAAPAQAAAAELAQVRRFPRLKPRSRRASPRRGSLIRCVSLHRRDRVSRVTLRSPIVSLPLPATVCRRWRPRLPWSPRACSSRSPRSL